MGSIDVVQLCHRLKDTPLIPAVPSVFVRTYRNKGDIAAWLAVRERAFAREKLGVRAWSVRDFEQEFLAKKWWNPDRCWLAETAGPAGMEAVGTVTLALRGEGEQAVPAVHWLTVTPAWRRRGVGRLLLATLEAAAWADGYREVWLETHAKWDKALALYRSCGYEAA